MEILINGERNLYFHKKMGCPVDVPDCIFAALNQNRMPVVIN